MKLTIIIKQAPFGSHQMVGERFSYVDQGFTFGRADSNDLVLPDPQCFVSSRHGMIDYESGQFTVFDQSSNGLYLDGEERPLGKGNNATLVSGMELKAGDYRLELEIGEGVDAEKESAPVSADSKVVPINENSHGSIPEEDIAVALALRLGLHGMSQTKLHSMPDEVTALIRSCISSVMDVLSSRRQLKTQLKIDNTVIQRSNNNALKVSLSADDAIDRMFTRSSEAYLPPEQALVEAFHDIGDHQVAMMAAIMQVYQQVVDRFEPGEVEQNLPQSAKANLFSGKRKIWDEYKENYDAIAANGTENVHEAFLRDFSAAYSDQLIKLRKERGKKAQ